MLGAAPHPQFRKEKVFGSPNADFCFIRWPFHGSSDLASRRLRRRSSTLNHDRKSKTHLIFEHAALGNGCSKFLRLRRAVLMRLRRAQDGIGPTSRKFPSACGDLGASSARWSGLSMVLIGRASAVRFMGCSAKIFSACGEQRCLDPWPVAAAARRPRGSAAAATTRQSCVTDATIVTACGGLRWLRTNSSSTEAERSLTEAVLAASGHNHPRFPHTQRWQ